MKNKFDNSKVAIAKFMMDHINGPKYEVSFTPKGNLMFKRFSTNEHFVISYFNNKWCVRRYAYDLDRCYRICPSHYIKKEYCFGYSYTERYYGWKTFNDALEAFVKFIEKNR
jgi:hypothetical protein